MGITLFQQMSFLKFIALYGGTTALAIYTYPSERLNFLQKQAQNTTPHHSVYKFIQCHVRVWKRLEPPPPPPFQKEPHSPFCNFPLAPIIKCQSQRRDVLFCVNFVKNFTSCQSQRRDVLYIYIHTHTKHWN